MMLQRKQFYRPPHSFDFSHQTQYAGGLCACWDSLFTHSVNKRFLTLTIPGTLVLFMNEYCKNVLGT